MYIGITERHRSFSQNVPGSVLGPDVGCPDYKYIAVFLSPKDMLRDSLYYFMATSFLKGHAVAQLVVGSIPDGVTGIFL